MYEYDFFEVAVDWVKDTRVVYPVFIVSTRLKDLMVRGGDFYAVWDDDTGMWSTDENTVIDIVDRALLAKKEELDAAGGGRVTVRRMKYSNGKSIDAWHKYVKDQMRDKYTPLDETITYENTKVKKSDFVSRRLPYTLQEGDISAYDELVGTPFDEDNRRKLEWAVGAIATGDSKHIQKFIVLYGPAGSGKSTFLNIVEQLFAGYTSTFDAKSMGAFNNQFALDSLKGNPLVSIQHDGDLSRIEDNTMLNSVVSHETIEVNPKYGRKYSAKFNTFLFLGTNKPVKITEAKSGLLRRLIDVKPTGNKIPYKRYQALMKQVKFELGAIAYHCIQVYKELGEDYYESYVPVEMMSATNDFYDFMQSCYDDYIESDHVTLTEAWKRYKEYCEFANAYQLPMRAVRNELHNYFREYEERARINGVQVRCLYSGFRVDKFQTGKEDGSGEDAHTAGSDATDTGSGNSGFGWLTFKDQPSWFDSNYGDWPAQYEKDYGKGGQPEQAWAKCKTKLSDLDTRQTHYTKPPENYPILMADFDLRNEAGEKDLNLNLKAALEWPKTYAELSKSGGGIHLYYLYDGDMSKLSRIYAPGIEIKVFTGGSAIRRKLTLCNNEPIAHITSGLPMKGERKKKVDWKGFKDAQHLHNHLVKEIKKNLAKEVHEDTTSSIHMIKKVLDDAYESGIPYNVTSFFGPVRDFAAASTHQADHCLECVTQMHFKSESVERVEAALTDLASSEERPLIVLDIEIYRPDPKTDNEGLFLVCWKRQGAPRDTIVAMVNPSAEEVEELFKCDIVGFN